MQNAYPNTDTFHRPTDRQLALLRAVDRYTSEHHYPPSGIELARELGLSTQRIYQLRAALIAYEALHEVPENCLRSPSRAWALTPIGHRMVAQAAREEGSHAAA